MTINYETAVLEETVMATRSAYEYFAIDIPEDLEKSIVAFLKQQRSGKRVAPPKRYERFG